MHFRFTIYLHTRRSCANVSPTSNKSIHSVNSLPEYLLSLKTFIKLKQYF